MIVAKPVIENQYWILQKDNQKIGNIEAHNGGFQVKIHNNVSQYRSIDMAAQRADITFVSAGGKPLDQKTNLVHGYPAAGRVHNAVWNIPLKLPLFTKTAKSKSWFAAGWYAVYRNRVWRAIYTPKLIALQRYKYRGPFLTEQQAQQTPNT